MVLGHFHQVLGPRMNLRGSRERRVGWPLGREGGDTEKYKCGDPSWCPGPARRASSITQYHGLAFACRKHRK